MNDRHPAGDSFPADPGADYSYSAYDADDYEQSAYGSYGTTGYAASAVDGGWATGGYDTTDALGFDTGAYGMTGTHEAAAPHGNAQSYDAQGYAGWADDSSGGYTTSGLIPQQPGPQAAEESWPQGWSTAGAESSHWHTDSYAPSGWDGGHGHQHDADPLTAAYESDFRAAGAYTTDGYATDAYTAGPYGAYNADGYAQSTYGTGVFTPDGYGAPADSYDVDAGTPGDAAYDAQATAAYSVYDAATHQRSDEPAADGTASASDPYGTDGHGTDAYSTDVYDTDAYSVDAYGTDPYEPDLHPVPDAYAPDSPVEVDDPARPPRSEAELEPGAAAPVHPGRGRRRSPKPRRSALLTVAAPSVAVLGVAGIAAASVLPSGEEESAQAAPDTTEVKASPANSKLDTQLTGLREAGDDFADRASRTQERIDLQKRQEEERKRKLAEAARKEALRPKFALPVEGAGISAYFGQAGINWMSVHTGLDFPVSYGTEVKAATDGTVRTQWDGSYGNMVVVTAPDGTETWYCHLSSTRIRSGSVKAGDVIGYSGNSGNSTGPHLHFEVRPGGGSAIDPLSWFRSHGLEPN